MVSGGPWRRLFELRGGTSGGGEVDAGGASVGDHARSSACVRPAPVLIPPSSCVRANHVPRAREGESMLDNRPSRSADVGVSAEGSEKRFTPAPPPRAAVLAV